MKYKSSHVNNSDNLNHNLFFNSLQVSDGHMLSTHCPNNQVGMSSSSTASSSYRYKHDLYSCPTRCHYTLSVHPSFLTLSGSESNPGGLLRESWGESRGGQRFVRLPAGQLVGFDGLGHWDILELFYCNIIFCKYVCQFCVCHFTLFIIIFCSTKSRQKLGHSSIGMIHWLFALLLIVLYSTTHVCVTHSLNSQ